MNYKQRYKEALERAKVNKIMSSIIFGIQHIEAEGYESINNVNISDIYDWLEKQDDYKKFNDEDSWSKDDAYKTDALICIVKSGGSIRPELRKEFVEWLESLKERLSL